MDEVWKPVVGYEGEYEVSDIGRVRSVARPVRNRWGTETIRSSKLRAIGVKREGYRFVNLFRKQHGKPMYVHRLVAMAFLPNPNDYPQVNHLDGDKSNNRSSNLEWCTGSVNCRHAINENLYDQARGESTPMAKVTERDVLEMRRLWRAGIMQKDIAEKFGVGRKAVTKIVNYQRWKHVA